MTKLTRVCPHCGEQGAIENVFCNRCGQNASGEHPPTEPANLPIPFAKAALPIIAGAAGVLVRIGWKLLQSRAAQEAAVNAASAVVQANLQKKNSTIMPRQNQPNQRRPAPTQDIQPRAAKRTIRIKSQWAVGDANGILRQGQSEHTIELD